MSCSSEQLAFSSFSNLVVLGRLVGVKGSVYWELCEMTIWLCDVGVGCLSGRLVGCFGVCRVVIVRREDGSLLRLGRL